MDNTSVEQPLKRFRVSWWLVGIAGIAMFVTIAYLIAGTLEMSPLYRLILFAPLVPIGAVVTFAVGVWQAPGVRPFARLAHGFGWMAVWIVCLFLPIGVRAAILYKQACDLPVPTGATRFDREIDWWDSPTGHRYEAWAMLPPDDPRTDADIADFIRRSLERQGWREVPGLSLRVKGLLSARYRRDGEFLELSISYYDDGTMLVVLNVEDFPRDGNPVW